MTHIIGRVTERQRLRNTPSGNPRYKLTIRDNRGDLYDVLTMRDGNIAHVIDEDRFVMEDHIFKVVGGYLHEVREAFEWRVRKERAERLRERLQAVIDARNDHKLNYPDWWDDIGYKIDLALERRDDFLLDLCEADIRKIENA